MKLYKRLIILGVVLVVSVVGFFVGRDLIIKNAPRPIYELNPVVANYRSTDVIEVSMYNQGETMTLRQRDDILEDASGQRVVQKVWYIVGEEDVKVNQARVNGLVINATNLTGRNIIEEDAKDLEQYGITGEYFVRIKTVQGVEYTVSLGDLLYNRDGFYAMRDDNRRVYSIAVSSALSLYATRADILDLNIFPTRNILDVESMRLDRDQKLVFTITSDRNYVWLMREPVICKAKIREVDEMIQSSLNLYIKGYVDISPEDLSEYGLDRPRYEMTLIISGKETTMQIGREEIRDGVFYAMVKGVNEVFTVESKTLDFLDSPTMDMVVEYQYTPEFQLLDSIEIQALDMNLLYEITYNEELEVNDYKFNGQSINRFDGTMRTFGVFFYEFATLVPITGIVPEWEITGEPFLSMKYTFNDGYYDNLEFYIKDREHCYYVRNGIYTGLTVSRQYLDEKEGFLKLVELIHTGELQRDFGITN
ncbi:MAG: DUF4340 domain-containing protein [Clostridia bacterium]